MTLPDSIVFDAEPLVAHATDEEGSEKAEKWLNEVAKDSIDAFVNYVNLTETHYVLSRNHDKEVANNYTTWLLDIGLTPVDTEDIWTAASNYILNYNPALGDAHAIATAEKTRSTLLVGDDTDYDDISEIQIKRFREQNN